VSRERIDVEFREVPLADPDFARLADAMGKEIDEMYTYRRLGSIGGVAKFSEDVEVALIGYADGAGVACGAVRRFDPKTAEIKRMYVEPTHRGRGAARALLTALEDAAREHGYPNVVLDTGPRQPHAKSLYESAGYRAIPDYNGNPFASYWFEKDL
jgi:GNAT superfamily N-acetyltransferase